ncbi:MULTISPECIES: sensor histidine kinase [Vibrio]|uniref:sensor histidine kinase n=1 Tax=Vibrio TaxID=662 RepID=UPI00039F5BA4|nr:MULTISPECIES: HAMP domain-containing sensor histidine kinase [Vibrio]KIP67117.1 histidine kinase [Vibrio harveyi]MCF6450286.1 HAMP domain-containing histidine kinase [Vibrio sp. MMG023]UQA53800.1 HAMP domain-containing histidine kinase [Vibrio sp. ED002]CAH1525727.1 Histidine kinase [Vibrio jasicida]CAH1609411.1 Histidine kinase [Vibrio jasicida]
MKIKDSLRVYVITVSAVLGLILAVVAGSYSTYNLYTGIDLMTKGVMLVKAETEEPQVGKPIINPPFIITANWDDLPLAFQLKFVEKDLAVGKLFKATETEYRAGRNANRFIYLLIKSEVDAQTKFVAVKINKNAFDDFTDTLNINLLPQLNYIVLFVAVLLTLFLIGVFFILRKITKPVEELKTWAMNIREKDDRSNIPDFKFSELNMMARVINSSLSAVQRSVKKEQEFIRYASHELRTPIAVIRSNSELMKKMIASDMPKERLLKNIQRIENNSLAMSDLCESLLWLNHENSTELKETMTSLGVLAELVVNEQRYLLDGKAVEVEVNVDSFECLHLSGMCKIVITNLIRNAFQHTIEGKVIIKQTGLEVEVINTDAKTNLTHETTGFGLGLLLIKKICDKYYWQYDEQVLANGRVVKVTFA